MTLGLSAAIWLMVYHWGTYKLYIKFLFEIRFSIIYYIYFSKKVERETLGIFLLPSPIIGYTIAYDITDRKLKHYLAYTVSDKAKMIEESESASLIPYIS